MGAFVSLAVLAGILAGAGAPEAQPAGAPAPPRMPRADESAGGGPAEAAGEVIVLPEDATIRIAPGNRFAVRPVETAQGTRVRLDVGGVAIEAPRLRVKSRGQILLLEAGEKKFTATTIQEATPGH
jgi:hypothetical protein